MNVRRIRTDGEETSDNIVFTGTESQCEQYVEENKKFFPPTDILLIEP